MNTVPQRRAHSMVSLTGSLYLLCVILSLPCFASPYGRAAEKAVARRDNSLADSDELCLEERGEFALHSRKLFEPQLRVRNHEHLAGFGVFVDERAAVGGFL